jgi:hypothetical protein
VQVQMLGTERKMGRMGEQDQRQREVHATRIVVHLQSHAIVRARGMLVIPSRRFPTREHCVAEAMVGLSDVLVM